MLDKHIDLLQRRVLKEETIAHEEKVFSLFEAHTQWIAKGKMRPPCGTGAPGTAKHRSTFISAGLQGDGG